MTAPAPRISALGPSGRITRLTYNKYVILIRSNFKGELVMVEKAKDLFHGEERYNCAQAVLAAFDAPAEKVLAAKAHGGGRAPEGLCGAFHAVKELVGDEKFGGMTGKMVEAAGGLSCREIRPLGKLSCRECVGLAAQLTQEEFHTL